MPFCADSKYDARSPTVSDKGAMRRRQTSSHRLSRPEPNLRCTDGSQIGMRRNGKGDGYSVTLQVNMHKLPPVLRRRRIGNIQGAQLLEFAEALHAQGMLRRSVLLKLRLLGKKAAIKNGLRRLR